MFGKLLGVTFSTVDMRMLKKLLHENPAARVTHNASQTINGSTLTVLAFNTERFDTDDIHDTVTNNSRLTCRTPGVYAIIANVQWTQNNTGSRLLEIRLNGATVIARQRQFGVSASEIAIATHYQLTAGDYVEVRVFQDSSGGGTLDVLATANISPEFSMVRIG